MAARISVRKILLFALNLVSTVLTLLTGLRENPVIVFVTGRYDLVRSRLIDGSINYNNIQDEALNRGVLADLKEVGNNYRFFSAPMRSPLNLAEDRSTCLRVNSMNVSMMTLNYNDFWGKGARRSQIFIFSISTSQCDILNFNPEWFTECIKKNGDSEDKCNQYIMDNFDTLSKNHLIQAGIEEDFGYPGAVFLKCARRPHRSFEYNTDLMVHQSYWAGGSYHVEIQSSLCVAEPVLRDKDWEWGLFKVRPKDQTANVVFAIENSGWFATIVTIAYGFVAITMMIQGVFAMILRVRTVRYIPNAARFLAEQRIFKIIFPFMSAALKLPHVENLVITFKGSAFMASDVWMNHWLYIGLSILEAVVNIRMGYVVLEMGTWMLGKKANLENFIFLCGALTKITWIMCLLHTLIRVGLKLTINSVRKLKVVRPKVLDFLEWYVDASALFLSYKIYSMLLCLILYIMWNVHGATTFMVHEPWFKRGVFGGAPSLSQFWGNEIICDLFILLIILTLCGIVVGALLLMTSFRAVASNQVIRLMQHRYFFVGWDVFIALEALGIDPHNPELVDNGTVRTNCSLGSILQQLYTSGCSGHVNLACDHIFMQNGLSADPPKFCYPIKRATAIGLCSARPGGVHTSTHGASTQDTERSKPMTVKPVVSKNGKSLFDRKLKLLSEGYTGKILLVDEDEPGCVIHNAESGRNEYEVMDAISQIGIMDIKPLLGGQKKLHIR